MCFTNELIISLEDPHQLDGWSRTGNRKMISLSEKGLLYPKKLKKGLYMSTTMDSKSTIKFIDALIDKFRLDTDCYYIE